MWDQGVPNPDEKTSVASIRASPLKYRTGPPDVFKQEQVPVVCSGSADDELEFALREESGGTSLEELFADSTDDEELLLGLELELLDESELADESLLDELLTDEDEVLIELLDEYATSEELLLLSELELFDESELFDEYWLESALLLEELMTEDRDELLGELDEVGASLLLESDEVPEELGSLPELWDPAESDEAEGCVPLPCEPAEPLDRLDDELLEFRSLDDELQLDELLDELPSTSLDELEELKSEEDSLLILDDSASSLAVSTRSSLFLVGQQ